MGVFAVSGQGITAQGNALGKMGINHNIALKGQHIGSDIIAYFQKRPILCPFRTAHTPHLSPLASHPSPLTIGVVKDITHVVNVQNDRAAIDILDILSNGVELVQK